MVVFITGNDNKYGEAKQHIPGLERRALDLKELQSTDLADILKHKLSQAMREIDGPCFVEDTSLNIDALGGLPGPFVKWFLKAMGPEGIAKLSDGSDALAVCGIAYYDGENEHVFFGETKGRIVAPRGVTGFGWDTIFAPEGREKTFAEMGVEQKQRISHRARALAKLAEHLQ